jgi:hypothetical protein
MTRYVPVVNFEGGVVETPMEEWNPEEIPGRAGLMAAAPDVLG